MHLLDHCFSLFSFNCVEIFAAFFFRKSKLGRNKESFRELDLNLRETESDNCSGDINVNPFQRRRLKKILKRARDEKKISILSESFSFFFFWSFCFFLCRRANSHRISFFFGYFERWR